MRVLILLSIFAGQALGFLMSSRSSGILSFSSRNIQDFSKISRSSLQSQSDPSETPRWIIEGGDTSETECSSSGDIARAAAAKAAAAALEKLQAEALAAAELEKLQAEASLKAKIEEEKRSSVLAAEALKVVKAVEVTAVAATPASKAVAVSSATISAPKTDLTKLSVGTDSFDVGLLIAFPIIVATLGFFFLFPLIGPQLAQTLPPVPTM